MFNSIQETEQYKQALYCEGLLTYTVTVSNANEPVWSLENENENQWRPRVNSSIYLVGELPTFIH